ncbi:MAG: host attachment protein [Candidatus Magasanikbacteria bacterium]
MQIPKKFRQFKEEPSLLVTTGWQAGKLYFAQDGKIEEIEELKVPHHQYSDKEGHFETRTSGSKEAIHSGAPKEKKKQHIRKEFLRRLIKLIKKVLDSKEVDSLYIFSPAEGLPSLEKKLPTNIREKVKSYYKGNYVKHDVQELLSVIKKEEPKPVEVMSEEAKKILESTESSQ